MVRSLRISIIVATLTSLARVLLKALDAFAWATTGSRVLVCWIVGVVVPPRFCSVVRYGSRNKFRVVLNVLQWIHVIMLVLMSCPCAAYVGANAAHFYVSIPTTSTV
jgi:ABC-type glycerol-3-phosphate transport system permease component